MSHSNELIFFYGMFVRKIILHFLFSRNKNNDGEMFFFFGSAGEKKW